MIMHVSALAQGAGGRFVVICSDERSGDRMVRELDPRDPKGHNGISGVLGRALRRR